MDVISEFSIKRRKKVEQWPSTNSSGIPQTETFSVFDNICKYNKTNLTKRQKKVPTGTQYGQSQSE